MRSSSFIHYHHFHPRVLQDGNLGPLSCVPSAVGNDLRYTKHDRKNASTYFAAPNYPLLLAKRDVVSIEESRRLQDALVTGSTVPDDATLRRSPEDREVVAVYNQMIDNPGKMSIEYCRLKQSLDVLMVEQSHRSKENTNLRADIDRLKKELDIQQKIELSEGLNRHSITSDAWHKENPEASHYLFGLGTFDQFKCYICEVFFPDVEFAFRSSGNLTEFEQLQLVLMKVHRDYEDNTVKIIFQRTGHSFVADIMKKWMPKLKRLGLYMSILDLDYTMDYVSEEDAREHQLPHYNIEGSPRDKHKNYLRATLPQEYIEAGYSDVGALVDGMVIRTDTVRRNPVIKRLLYNDKVDDSGGLIMTWTAPSGLCFEHTGLYFGRLPEMRAIELWGTVDPNQIALN